MYNQLLLKSFLFTETSCKNQSVFFSITLKGLPDSFPLPPEHLKEALARAAMSPNNYQYTRSAVSLLYCSIQF